MVKMLSASVERFFAFMQERESIRLKRLAGYDPPWTTDVILQKYKFTNVKREHDKTSQLLIAEFYKPNYNAPREQLLLNCAIARYIGTIAFMREIGWQKTFDAKYLKSVIGKMLIQGKRVYTGAYIITNGGNHGPKELHVIDTILAELWAGRSKLIKKEWTEWRPFVEALQTFTGFGGAGFMAKEVSLDTRYTGFWKEPPTDIYDWTPIGPGSKRGVGRIMGKTEKPYDASNRDTLNACIELYDMHKKYWPRTHVGLEVHDIQFQLCEWDKYERTRLGEGVPRNRYRPKSPQQGTLL